MNSAHTSSLSHSTHFTQLLQQPANQPANSLTAARPNSVTIFTFCKSVLTRHRGILHAHSMGQQGPPGHSRTSTRTLAAPTMGFSSLLCFVSTLSLSAHRHHTRTTLHQGSPFRTLNMLRSTPSALSPLMLLRGCSLPSCSNGPLLCIKRALLALSHLRYHSSHRQTHIDADFTPVRAVWCCVVACQLRLVQQCSV